MKYIPLQDLPNLRTSNQAQYSRLHLHDREEQTHDDT